MVDQDEQLIRLCETAAHVRRLYNLPTDAYRDMDADTFQYIDWLRTGAE